MRTAKAWIAVAGTYRQRTVQQVIIQYEGDGLPYRIVAPDGAEYIRDGELTKDGHPFTAYVPASWIEVPGPVIGPDDPEDYE